MAEPYVGEIRMFAGNFAPEGWAVCDGSLLPIAENEVLFTLIGTTYGGDGQRNFALPDLRGKAPVHRGPNAPQGSMATLAAGHPTTPSKSPPAVAVNFIVALFGIFPSN